jgi:ribonuclease HI
LIEVWIDGLCEPVNPSGTACIGYVIKRGRQKLAEGSEVIGTGEGMTNNVAEYNALIHALKRMRSLELGEEEILIRSDSKLLVNQMMGNWKAKAPLIIPLYHEAKLVAAGLHLKIVWIPREENEEADRLARTAYESTL